jgi:hypothetical protein
MSVDRFLCLLTASEKLEADEYARRSYGDDWFHSPNVEWVFDFGDSRDKVTYEELDRLTSLDLDDVLQRLIYLLELSSAFSKEETAQKLLNLRGKGYKVFFYAI